MPERFEYPIAAALPESGTGMTQSPSTGLSSASRRPRASLDSCTGRPKTIESGREKYTCSKTHCEREMDGANCWRLTPSSLTTTISPGLTSST